MPKLAKDLTQEEIKQYWRTLEERESGKNELKLRRFQDAWNIAKKAREILCNKYRAKKVVVFGSLTDFQSFNRWADIDLAVWGIPSEIYFKAVAEIISLTFDFKIDIVDLDDCNDSLKKTIEKKGIEIC